MFNLIKKIKKNFCIPFEISQSRAEFISAPLSEEESSQIHRLLEASSQEGQFSSEEIDADHHALTEITTQIRAIEKQGVLLHRERIFKAQNS